MCANKLELLFEDFLPSHAQDKNVEDESLDELFELAERQWNTYRKLNSHLIEKIQTYLLQGVNLESPQSMDILLSIIPRLGLTTVFNRILEHRSNIQNIEVRKLIDESYAEYGTHVDDPFWGIKPQ